MGSHNWEVYAMMNDLCARVEENYLRSHVEQIDREFLKALRAADPEDLGGWKYHMRYLDNDGREHVILRHAEWDDYYCINCNYYVDPSTLPDKKGAAHSSS